MIAFDTSLVIRIATGDDERQRRAALALLDSETVFVSKTVMLETEWVLRSRYGLSASEIHAFLNHLVESQSVVIEDDDAVRRALDFYAAGADFADALHLASCSDMVLYTLDRTFCRAAIRKGVAPAVKVIRG